ncbi:MAG: Gfo/Idh/MocA family oxidoreductase [Alphaproteobacteria bacterium]
MNDHELRVGIIGLGVGEAHIAGFEQDSRCRVTTLCDIDETHLGEVSARHPNARTTPSPKDVLDDPDIDAVSIASYDDAHAAQVLAAVSAGKHIFVEKPLCFHDEEFAAISEALTRRPDVQISSNLILRKYPRFARLKALLDSDELGDIYYLEGDYNYGRMEKILNGWRGTLPFYSVTHGGGIHMIDLLLWLTGRRPVEVSAMGTQRASRDTEFSFNDTVVALLRFPDDSIAKVSANFPCVYPHFHDVVVFGTNGTWRNAPDAARLYRSRDPETPPDLLDDPYPGSFKGDLIPSFVSLLLDGGDAEVSRADVLDAMAVSLAIERAVTTGKPQDINYH